ncbi:MAG: hypothetical protein QHC90_26090 [Shinella sp.]|nr:hypothetical protein [Shinella sp.]
MSSIKVSYDKNHPEEYLNAGLAAYHEALHACIVALVEVKGTEDLTWFDDLHQQAIRSAKGTITEHIPVEVDAGAVRFGFEIVDAEFKQLRVGLVKK